jgi:hypothetical protein
MVFHGESHDDKARRTVRTEVTIQERQRAVLFSSAEGMPPDSCPLCGNPLFPATAHMADMELRDFEQKLSKARGTQPRPDQPVGTIDPQHAGDSRRLR